MAAEAKAAEDLADFVLEHSKTLLECVADDPSIASCWESVLPPDSMMPRDRCLGLLRRLLRLQLEDDPPPLRICDIRNTSLYESLAGCDSDELADAARTAEFLQLPVFLTSRVEAQAAAELARNSALPLSEVISSSRILAPLLQKAEEFLQSRAAPAPWPGFWRALLTADGRSSPLSTQLQTGLRSGLCSDSCRAIAETGTQGRAAWLIGYVAGQGWMHGCGRAIAVPDAAVLAAAAPHCTGELAAAAACAFGAAAFFGHAALLRALAVAGWPLGDAGGCRGCCCDKPAAAALCSSAATGGAGVAAAAPIFPAAEAGEPTAAAADGDGDADSDFDLSSAAARPMNAIAWACAGGHLDILQALLADDCRVAGGGAAACGGSDAFAASASADGSAVEPFPPSCRLHWSAADSLLAAAHGHVHVLRWVWHHGLPLHRALPAAAAQSGCEKAAPLLRFLVDEVKRPWRASDAAACAAAVAAGDLPLLQQLRSLGCPWDASQVAHLAAGTGSLPMLAWAASQGAPLDDSVAAEAASAGSLPILDWLRDSQGVDMCGDASIVSAAAGAGHIHVLRWCREEAVPPLPLTFEATARAAAGGHLAALQWLRAQKPVPCPWNSTAVEMARRRGHDAVADWAIANGCPAGHLKWRREGQTHWQAAAGSAGDEESSRLSRSRRASGHHHHDDHHDDDGSAVGGAGAAAGSGGSTVQWRAGQ